MKKKLMLIILSMGVCIGNVMAEEDDFSASSSSDGLETDWLLPVAIDIEPPVEEVAAAGEIRLAIEADSVAPEENVLAPEVDEAGVARRAMPAPEMDAAARRAVPAPEVDAAARRARRALRVRADQAEARVSLGRELGKLLARKTSYAVLGLYFTHLAYSSGEMKLASFCLLATTYSVLW